MEEQQWRRGRRGLGPRSTRPERAPARRRDGAGKPLIARHKARRMAKTPSQNWQDVIAAHKAACRSIVSSSRAVRYAGVINKFGRTLAGATRPGVKPHLKPEEAKNEFFAVSTILSLRKKSSAGIGPLDHAVLRHERITVVAFPHGTDTYYVSVDAGHAVSGPMVARMKKLAGA